MVDVGEDSDKLTTFIESLGIPKEKEEGSKRSKLIVKEAQSVNKIKNRLSVEQSNPISPLKLFKAPSENQINSPDVSPVSAVVSCSLWNIFLLIFSPLLGHSKSSYLFFFSFFFYSK